MGCAQTESRIATSGAASQDVSPVTPAFDQYRQNLVEADLWRRPDLSPRDRSLVTVSALLAAGHTGQISFHLSRAMDSGLTKAEAPEVLTHLAFYAGWPNVLSALPAVRDVLQRRSD